MGEESDLGQIVDPVDINSQLQGEELMGVHEIPSPSHLLLLLSSDLYGMIMEIASCNTKGSQCHYLLMGTQAIEEVSMSTSTGAINSSTLNTRGVRKRRNSTAQTNGNSTSDPQKSQTLVIRAYSLSRITRSVEGLFNDSSFDLPNSDDIVGDTVVGLFSPSLPPFNSVAQSLTVLLTCDSKGMLKCISLTNFPSISNPPLIQVIPVDSLTGINNQQRMNLKERARFWSIDDLEIEQFAKVIPIGRGLFQSRQYTFPLLRSLLIQNLISNERTRISAITLHLRHLIQLRLNCLNDMWTSRTRIVLHDEGNQESVVAPLHDQSSCSASPFDVLICQLLRQELGAVGKIQMGPLPLPSCSQCPHNFIGGMGKKRGPKRASTSLSTTTRKRKKAVESFSPNIANIDIVSNQENLETRPRSNSLTGISIMRSDDYDEFAYFTTQDEDTLINCHFSAPETIPEEPDEEGNFFSNQSLTTIINEDNQKL